MQGSSRKRSVARLNVVPQEKLLQSYLHVIFRYKYLIACIAFFIFSASVYVTVKMPKQYMTHAVISMGSYLPSNEGTIVRMLRDDMQDDSFIQNQLILLSSLATAEKALRHDPEILTYLLEPDELPEEQRDKNGNVVPPELDVHILRRFLGHTGHELIRGSKMVKIIGRSSSPDLAVKIANALAYAFVTHSQSQLIEAADANLTVLRGRVKEKSRIVDEKKLAIREYVKEYANLIVQGDDSSNPVNLKLRNTISALSAATLSRAATERELRELSSASSSSGLGLDIAGRNKFAQLQKDIDDYQMVKRRNSTSADFWLQQKKQEIELAKSEIALIRKQKLKDAEIQYRANVEREDLLKRELEKINQELAGKNSDMARKARIQLEYSILQSELNTAKTMYTEIVKSLEQARFASNKDFLTVKVVDKASRPGAPSSPNVKFNLLLGSLFGLMLGIAVAYTLAFSDNTVRTTDQLAALLGIKILGIIPTFGGKRFLSYGAGEIQIGVEEEEEDLDEESPSLLLLERPESFEAEAFRSLRTMILHSFEQTTDDKVLLVTSGLPLDGKSTVVGNLAVSFGKTDQSTVLIEGDVRKPSMHDKFGLSTHGPGLREYLTGEAELEDVLSDTDVDSLKVILAGKAEMTPGELFGSKRMEKLIDELSKRYDRVLIDSPPVSDISDALLLSRYSDGVLLVVRSGSTPRPVAEHALSRLQQIEAPIIGTVLNDLHKSSSYGYASYYSKRSYSYFKS